MATTAERHRANKMFTPGPARRIIAPQQRHTGNLTLAAVLQAEQARQEPSDTQDSLFDGSIPSSWISTQDTQTVSREEYEEGERLRLEQRQVAQRRPREPEKPRSPSPSPATNILRSDLIPPESSSQQYLERALRSNEKRDLDDPDYDETQQEPDLSTSRDYITRSRRSGLGFEDIQLLDESDDVMDFENTPDIDSSIPSKRRSPGLTSPRSNKKSRKPAARRSPRPELEPRFDPNHNGRTQPSAGGLFVSQSTTVPETQDQLTIHQTHIDRVQPRTASPSVTLTPETQEDPVALLLSQAETQTQTDFAEAAQIWRREDSDSSQNLSHLSLQDSTPASASASAPRAQQNGQDEADITTRTDDQLIKDLGIARKLEQQAKEAARKALLAEKEAIERREKIWTEMQRRFACASPNRRSS